MAFFYPAQFARCDRRPDFGQGGRRWPGRARPEKAGGDLQAAFDRVTAERYSMPLVPNAAIVAHDKNVKLLRRAQKPEGILNWKYPGDPPRNRRMPRFAGHDRSI